MDTDTTAAPTPTLAVREITRVDPVGESMATGQVDRRRDVLTLGDPHLSDPFLFLSEDWFSRVGFEWHPHRGFETVTYVIDGELEHKDNAGGEGVLQAGDLQWVTTGRGVIHSETAHERRPVRTLQLWLNLPAALKMSPPRYQDLRGQAVPLLRDQGVAVRVFAGRVHGVQGPAQTLWPTTVVDGRLEPGARFVLEVPGDHAAFFYVIKGALRTSGYRVPEEHVGWSDAGAPGPSGIALVADGETHFIAYAAKPIKEPIFQHGPFVMNYRAEIVQAIEDYQRGAFGPIP
jgi:redox-sensitive bicupin YhaK (pirin superfamily)